MQVIIFILCSLKDKCVHTYLVCPTRATCTVHPIICSYYSASHEATYYDVTFLIAHCLIHSRPLATKCQTQE
jgi:hypothetical protein